MWNYKVKECRVVDGDTIEVLLDLGFSTFRKERIRLARINSPEMATAAGKSAKAHLVSVLAEQTNLTVTTIKDAKDKYGRYIGEFFLGDSNINDEMVSSGYAVYKDY